MRLHLLTLSQYAFEFRLPSLACDVPFREPATNLAHCQVLVDQFDLSMAEAARRMLAQPQLLQEPAGMAKHSPTITKQHAEEKAPTAATKKAGKKPAAAAAAAAGPAAAEKKAEVLPSGQKRARRPADHFSPLGQSNAHMACIAAAGTFFLMSVLAFCVCSDHDTERALKQEELLAKAQAESSGGEKGAKRAKTSATGAKTTAKAAEEEEEEEEEQDEDVVRAAARHGTRDAHRRTTPQQDS